jgi:hypothetical protein
MRFANVSFIFSYFSKIVELEEELRVVGNNLKSLEVSEEKVKTSKHCVMTHKSLSDERKRKEIKNIPLKLSVFITPFQFDNIFHTYLS